MSHDAEVRKTVTVIFSDGAGWTALGDGLDPESLRHVMSRYFDEMRRVIERHGGRVEKYIGDAIMAVFGIPVVREDDALRAVRAAVDMRNQLIVLNEELHRDYGVKIETRTGLETGEVVVGGETEVLATGEAVTVAARLEQTAAPGEILIGEPTFRLVRDAVDAESVGPLELKGKSRAVAAWRLIDIVSEAPGIARRLASPLVGRTKELALLRQAFDDAVEGSACQARTVLGEAGVGKSRLAAEFMSRLEQEATVVRGRCLPYGEGITFWPVAEVVKQLAGIETSDDDHSAILRIRTLIGSDSDATSIADHVASITGRSDIAYPVQETFWAIRKLFEAVAITGPLVVAFDDIHWAEPTFLDLVEYLWGWSTDRPILILCSARPLLLETRPGWGSEHANVASLKLSPLSREETNVAIENLVSGDELDHAVRRRISEVAEGNPLFAEEILRMLVDEGLIAKTGGGWTPAGDLAALNIPPTIHALLDARLEALPTGERDVLQRASIMGKLFSWGAVSDLSPEPDRPLVGSHLQTLVRRALIHPDRAEFAGEDGFAFSHILFRDAAYRSIPKDTRAALHQRFARWLESKSTDAAEEYEEIIGYHLEQSCRYHSELGSFGDQDLRLAEEGARRLAAAGERAFARNDIPATINLFSRAAALLGEDDPFRLSILPDLATALVESGDQSAGSVFTEAFERADAIHDDRLRAHAVVQRWVALGDGDVADLQREAEQALGVFEAAKDERGLSQALRALSDVDYRDGRIAARDEMLERALLHARNAGDAREVSEIYFTLSVDLNQGSTPALDGIRRCEAILEEEGGNRSITGSMFHALAHLRSMRGEFDEAMDLADRFRTILLENGSMSSYWFFSELPFNIKMLAEAPNEAVELLTEACWNLEHMGEKTAILRCLLSQGLYDAGRFREAWEQVELAGDIALPSFQQESRGVRAKLLAREGAHEDAEVMAREAVAFFESTELLITHAAAQMNLGEVLHLAGRSEQAASAVEKAIALFERKGDIVSAGIARRTHERFVETRTDV